MRLRRTAAATLLVGMVGGTWALAAPGASAISIGPVDVTTPTVPDTVPVVDTALSQTTVPTVPTVTVPVPLPVPTVPLPDPVSVPEVVRLAQTCVSFATQQAAQAALAVDPALATVLDDDGDGRACELLPALPVDVPGVIPKPDGNPPVSGGAGEGFGGSAGSTGAGVTGSALPSAGGAAAATGSPVIATAAPSAAGVVPTSPAKAVGGSTRRPTGATAAHTGDTSSPAALASAPVEVASGRADGDGPGGHVAVTVLAGLLVLATAAGAYRQWSAERSVLPA